MASSHIWQKAEFIRGLLERKQLSNLAEDKIRAIRIVLNTDEQFQRNSLSAAALL
jgi:hypothetical protein